MKKIFLMFAAVAVLALSVAAYAADGAKTAGAPQSGALGNPQSGAVAREGFGSETIRRMGVFISNFTELGMYNLPDAQDLTDDEYVRFGVFHNEVNNFKLWKHEKDGNISTSASNIEASIMRYFGKKFIDHCAVPDYDISYDAKAKRYTIPAADGEMRIYARVRSVTQHEDGTLTLAGELYNSDNESDTYGPFTATVKPHKWNKRNTWALLSLSCDDM